MNGRFLVAGLVATAIGFLGGWLIWGVLLMDYYNAHTTEGALALQREEMVFWAMFLAQLSFGFLIAWILWKTNSTTAVKGAVTAVIVSTLIVVGMDLFWYAYADMYTGLEVLFVDILVNACFAAILGAVVGWVLGYKRA